MLAWCCEGPRSMGETGDSTARFVTLETPRLFKRGFGLCLPHSLGLEALRESAPGRSLWG